MASVRMFYGNGVDDVRLGDRVELRRVLRRPLRGVVAYIPGISIPHPEMEMGGIRDWAVRFENRTVKTWPFIPGQRISPKIHLISRDEADRDELFPAEKLL